MKDKALNELAERFAGHESPVPTGTWEAISGKLSVANGETFRETLQQKFAGHEVPVDAQVWGNISNQLGHTAAPLGLSTTTWWATGIAASLVTAGAIFFATQDSTTVPVQPLVAETLPAQVQVNPENATSAISTAPVLIAPENNIRSAPAAPKNERRSTTEEQPTLGDNTERPTEPATSPAMDPKGEPTVNHVLQDIVDHYVTEPKVVVTETVPPPTPAEMPSPAVRTNVSEDEPAGNEESAEDQLGPALISAAEPEVYIPTAFSPNGDGVNDEFAATGQNYEKVLVRIFSANSNAQVFAADNLATKWNGRMMNTGVPCEPGMYFYAMEVTGKDGKTWSKGEVVRLFR